MTPFVCPHCGRRTSTDRTDLLSIDLGNGLPDALFVAWPEDTERHIDERLCCAECFDRADPRPLIPGPTPGSFVRHGPDDLHPYGRHHHVRHRLARAR